MIPLPASLGLPFPPAAAGGGTSYVNSVQAVEITVPTGSTSATATITSVDTSRSVVFFGGFTTDHTGSAAECLPRAELTNATTVTAYRNTSSATFSVTVRAAVVEFTSAAVDSVQAGTITVSGATANTATVSSVDTSRSAVFHLGNTTTETGTNTARYLTRLALTNATTVTATRGSSFSAVTAGYAVVQFASGVTSSVQQRAVSLTNSNASDTDTVTSVNAARTMLIGTAVSTTSSSGPNSHYTAELTNATTVTLTRDTGSATTRTVGYTLVEFAVGVLNSVQRGTTSLASASSADTTVTSVNTAKAALISGGFRASSTGVADRWASAKLLDATTVRAQKNTAGSTTSVAAWEAAEFN